jgi:hypothetical protein
MTLQLRYVTETEHARLYERADGKQVWIPRSVCRNVLKWPNGVHAVTVEEWWAQKSGLLENYKNFV